MDGKEKVSEQTPEEIIAEYYFDALEGTAGESGSEFFDGKAVGKVEAIEFFAKAFNIKITGVNE